MKTNLLFAALLTLTTAASMAQGPDRDYRRPDYNQPGYDYGRPTNNGPGYGNDRRGPRGDWGNDYREDVFRIERLDRLVNLTGWQKRDLFRLEQYYDRELTLAPRRPDIYRRLMWQKSQDVLAVLSPRQRDRLAVMEQYRPYCDGRFNDGYSNDDRNRPGRGRRW